MKKLFVSLSVLWLLTTVSVPVALSGGVKPAESGTYTVVAKLEGGSGRATLEEPTSLTVKGENITAHFVWSSRNYTVMVVGGKTYKRTNKEGKSTFDIPVTLDKKIEVQAETVAMGEPRMIGYTIFLDSQTLKGQPPSLKENMPLIILTAVGIVLISGLVVLGVWAHKRRIKKFDISKEEEKHEEN